MDQKQPWEKHQQQWEKQLESGIRRMQDALQTNQRQQGKLIESLLVAAGQTALEHMNEKLREKQERRRLREERRRRRRERRNKPASAAQGVVFAGAAAVMLYFALLNPMTLWWLLFVVFGFAMAAASILSKAFSRKELPAGEEGAEGLPASTQSAAAHGFKAQIDARVARVEAIADKILAEIKSGPQIVREVVHRPEDTLKALRSASKELARRELELRSSITVEDEQRLRSERDALVFRIGAEKDEVVRARLGSALSALDAQLAQRAELLTSASRFEAEGTRIVYTLENLHTQILRARSADASGAEVAGAGLRLSLEQLGEEINAVAEALEAVNGAEARMPRIQPVSSIGPDEGGSGRPRDRERS